MDVEMTDINDPRPEDGPCYFFRLPRELRDMVYEYACVKNTYITRHFEGEKIKRIPYPTSSATTCRRLQFTAIEHLPNTLCRNQAVCKQILDETLPILIHNTEFDFHCATEFERFVTDFPAVRRYVTSVRIHVRPSFQIVQGRKVVAMNDQVSDYFAQYVNFCPRLVRLSWVNNTDVAHLWIGWDRLWRRGRTTKTLGDNRIVKQLKQVRGISEFHLLVVDSPRYGRVEQIRSELEKDISASMSLPRG
jgi:hypothetical protein